MKPIRNFAALTSLLFLSVLAGPVLLEPAAPEDLTNIALRRLVPIPADEELSIDLNKHINGSSPFSYLLYGDINLEPNIMAQPASTTKYTRPSLSNSIILPESELLEPTRLPIITKVIIKTVTAQ